MAVNVCQAIERGSRGKEIEDFALSLERVHTESRKREARERDRMSADVRADVEDLNVFFRAEKCRQHPTQELDLVLFPRSILFDPFANHRIISVHDDWAVVRLNNPVATA